MSQDAEKSAKDAKQQANVRVHPGVTQLIRDRSVDTLMSLLGSMFDGIDDTFFELADYAHNNKEQNLYFDSMREVRIKRRGMESIFRQQMEADFRKLMSGHMQEKVVAPMLADHLELVSDDLLEESVAINNMISKVRSNFPGQLLQLVARWNAMFQDMKVTEENNPLDPQQVVRAFAEAVGTLDLEIKTKLIVYKQFDRYVLSQFDRVVIEANQILIDNGVLPNMRSTIRKDPVRGVYRPRRPAPVTATPTLVEDVPAAQLSGLPAGAEVFSTLQNLLASNRIETGAASTLVGGTGSGPVVAVQPDDLMGLLSQLQFRALPGEQGELDAEWLDAPLQIDLRGELRKLLEAASQGGVRKAVGQSEDDVINIVAMLFEFILDDHNIPSQMQALISRLQIPVLKVALKDKGFFNNPNHPARKLLNDMAKAAIGWGGKGNENDPLFKKMHQLVHRILREFNDDVALFEVIQKEFADYLSQDHKRAQAVETRTRQAAEGMAKAQQARQFAAAKIGERLQGKTLPATVIEILQNPWANLLVLHYLREGPESEPFNRALQTADDLIWSVQLQTGLQAKQRWARLMPGLMRRIREGLAEVAFHPADMSRVLTELWQIHGRMINSDQHPDAEKAKAAVAAAADVAAAVAAATPEVKVNAPEAVVEMVTVEVEEAPTAVSTERYDASLSPFIKQAEEMRVGQWVELSDAVGTRFRCKLAARIRATDTFIFVNRRGAKIAERKTIEFARDLKLGMSRILDSGMLIDRALEAIIGRLNYANPRMSIQ